MNDLRLFLNSKSIPLAEIASRNPGPGSPFEQAVIGFCQEWIGGKNEFEFHTSGSTGIPKQVAFHRHQLEASAAITQMAFDLRPSETSLLCLDPSLVAGRMMLVRSLMVGMNIIAVEPTANPLLAVSAGPIDFAAFVPYQLRAIFESHESSNRLSSIKSVIIGGASLAGDLVEKVQSLKSAVYATYGMTETLTHIALQRLNGPKQQDHFEVLPGITIGTDERGCLTVKANHLGEAPVVTNDLVALLSPRKFLVLGRIDMVINSGGKKVIPEKIEHEVGLTFASLGLNALYFVAGLPDKQLGEKVCLIVQSPPYDSAVVEAILASLRRVLPKYEVPKEIFYTKEFAMRPSGKIDRRATLAHIILIRNS